MNSDKRAEREQHRAWLRECIARCRAEVARYEKAVERRPNTYRPRLAEAQHTLGKFYWWRHTPASYRTAFRLFTQALRNYDSYRGRRDLTLHRLTLMSDLQQLSLRLDDDRAEEVLLGLLSAYESMAAAAPLVYGEDVASTFWQLGNLHADARRFGEPKALGTEVIDGAKAIELAKSYVGEQRVKSAVSGAETAGALASYGVVLTLNDGTVLNCEVTKKGGRLLWMVPEHASFPQSLTAEECIRRGQAFLSAHGYGEMEQNHYQIYDGLAVINFVALQDGVLLYPDLVKVQVRMDTGEIVGMEANNYLMNHTVRTALSPSLTEAQARQRAGERLEVKNVRLCVIPYRDEERLCYELTGQRDGQEFRVYLDGNTGEELEILLMVQTGGGMLSA